MQKKKRKRLKEGSKLYTERMATGVSSKQNKQVFSISMIILLSIKKAEKDNSRNLNHWK